MDHINPTINAQRWADLVAEAWNRETELMVPPLILLVEDDDDSRDVLVEQFVADGYHVAAVADGSEALHFVRNGLEAGLEAYRPDVLVSDIRMPGISGLELLSEIRGLMPALPAVMMTGFGSEKLRQDALTLGCDEVLFKPLSYADMEQTVRRLLLASALVPEFNSNRKRCGEHNTKPWSPYRQ